MSSVSIRVPRWARVFGLALLLVQTLALGAAYPADAASVSQAGSPTASQSDPVAGERFFHDQRVGPSGTFPSGYLLHARQQLADGIRSGKIPTVDAHGRLKAVSPNAAGQPTLSISSWSLIGPAPISEGIAGSISDAGPYPIAGRVTAVAAINQNTVYLGAADGGVWKTTNGGSNWSAITDQELISSLSVGAIAIDPNSSSTVYVGLGEQNFSIDSASGLGILKSTDGGSTWSLKGSTLFTGQSIGRIAVDPNNSSDVWAAASNGLAFSTDGGTTWSLAYSTQNPVDAVTDVVIDSTSSPGSSTVYFAVGNTSGDTNNGVWYTYLLTNGQPATPNKLPGNGSNLFPTGTGRIRLAITKTQPAVIFAIATNSSSVTYPLGTLAGVWKTTDAGGDWIQQANPDTYANSNLKCAQCNYDLDIEVYPTTVSGNYVVAALTLDLFTSTNTTSTWTNTTNIGVSANAHTDQHAFAFVPGNSSDYFFGNDGGVYSSFVSFTGCILGPFCN